MIHISIQQKQIFKQSKVTEIQENTYPLALYRLGLPLLAVVGGVGVLELLGLVSSSCTISSVSCFVGQL